MITEQNTEVKVRSNAPSVVSIIGFILSFLIWPLGFILCIIDIIFGKKNRALSIAGAAVSVVLTLGVSLYVAFMASIMAPAMGEFNETKKVRKDLGLAGTISMELLDCSFNADFIENNEVPYCTEYTNIEDIPKGRFRDELEQNLGKKLEDLKNEIVSHHKKDAQIQYILTEDNKCYVRITTTDSEGYKRNEEQYFIDTHVFDQ